MRAAILAILVASLAACSGLESDPVTLIKDVRLLAVRADPPYIGVPSAATPTMTPTTMSALVAAHPDPSTLCYAWQLCPYAWEKDGAYKCLDPLLELDLGTGQTASLTVFDVFKSLENIEQVAEKVGLQVTPSGGSSGSSSGSSSGGGPPGGNAGDGLGLEVKIMLLIARPEVFGGTCPTDAGAAIRAGCPQREGCVQAYTEVGVAQSELQRNTAPQVDALELDGVRWPAHVTPTLAPVKDAKDNTSGPLGDKDAGYMLEPIFPEAAVQLIAPAKGEQPEVRENLTFSWFTDRGRFRYGKTTHLHPDNRLSPTPPGEDDPDEKDNKIIDVTIWMIARDNRNGVDWRIRHARIDVDADAGEHPICGPNPGWKVCTDACADGHSGAWCSK